MTKQIGALLLSIILLVVGCKDKGTEPTIRYEPTWRGINSPHDVDLSQLAVSADSSIWAISDSQVFRLRSDTSWERVLGPNTEHRFASIALDGNGNILMGGLGAIYWQERTWWTYSDAISIGGDTVGCLVVNSRGFVFAGTRQHGVLRTVTPGAVGSPWYSCTGIASGSINSLVARSNGDIIATTDSSSSIVYQSTDDGITWMSVGSLAAGDGCSLALDDHGSIFLGTNRGIFKTADNGLHWLLVCSTASRVTSLLAMSGNRLLATAGSVYYSDDAGANWRTASTGLAGSPAISITRGKTGNVYVGTRGDGIYESTHPFSP